MEDQLMRKTSVFTGSLFTASLLAAVVLLTTAGGALADDTPTPSPSSSDGSGVDGPTEAGTSFRTATAFRPGQQATADASTGDYLYWVFPVDTGQRATVTAKVTLPDSAARKGSATWQVDVYDGLRRRQPCVYGARTRAVPADADTLELRCTLRTVRAWAEPWSNDPLPGSYYIRLTVLTAQEEDLGLPVQAEIGASLSDKGGSEEVGGGLAAPLTATAALADADGDGSDDEPSKAALASEPEGGWSSGWWTDRWIWTAAGGVLGALAAIGGYSLTRPSRSSRRPS
jgi:hypothetical protein